VLHLRVEEEGLPTTQRDAPSTHLAGAYLPAWMSPIHARDPGPQASRSVEFSYICSRSVWQSALQSAWTGSYEGVGRVPEFRHASPTAATGWPTGATGGGLGAAGARRPGATPPPRVLPRLSRPGVSSSRTFAPEASWNQHLTLLPLQLPHALKPILYRTSSTRLPEALGRARTPQFTRPPI
jgi:hypothetical protein